MPDVKTNADYIRSMSDEELAEWTMGIQQVAIFKVLHAVGVDAPDPNNVSAGDLKLQLDWLRQPKEST